MNLLLDGENANECPGYILLWKKVQCILRSNKVEPAEEIIINMLNSLKVPNVILFNLRAFLFYIYIQKGRIKEAAKVIEENRKKMSSIHQLTDYDHDYLDLLKAKDKHNEEIRYLKEKIPTYPQTTYHLFVFISSLIIILAMLKKTKEAEKTLKNAVKNKLIEKHRVALFPYYFIIKDYKTTCEILTAFSKTGFSYNHAFRLLIAGIVFELAGDKNKAKEVWKEVIQRYPSGRINYYSSLAEALINNVKVDFKDNPYNYRERSQISYLTGLLFESRGNKKHAQLLFQYAADTDPTNWWPAYLAKEKLGKRK